MKGSGKFGFWNKKFLEALSSFAHREALSGGSGFRREEKKPSKLSEEWTLVPFSDRELHFPLSPDFRD